MELFTEWRREKWTDGKFKSDSDENEKGEVQSKNILYIV